MPYTLEDFPIETSEKTIEVELPAGELPDGKTYTFELIVEDSAGYQSLADAVTITVVKKPIPLPEVNALDPDFVTLGTSQKVRVSGKNLATIKSVRFLQGEELEPRVFAVIDHAEDELVDITVTAHGRAPFKEPYAVEVLTQRGKARWDKLFTVAKKPEIEDFAPKSLDAGEKAKPFIVKGRYLRMDDRYPAPKVAFLDGATIDRRFDVQLMPESTAEALVLEVTARNDDGQLKIGNRTLRVTTLAGSTEAKDAFVVTQE
jgi:hypothetical protein